MEQKSSSPHVLVKQFQQNLEMITMMVLKLCKIAYRATNEHVITS